ncbi:MAG: HypC/HybG/HupF family hydrogenase formation chaperone [Planctomycetes bacterium]|nr:HypC/HybG/HupF family hydrogenase formation chaperone [Planctomycetota bacterium]NOG53778.1 HypC/HybG/HupF family hydrogenase formation chaperone [Planctomycetota bacterium]
MCLAVPARIEKKNDQDEAWVLIGHARVRVNLALTPEADLGDWVLVHAGFAIQQLDEDEARETWEMIDSLPEHERNALLAGGPT